MGGVLVDDDEAVTRLGEDVGLVDLRPGGAQGGPSIGLIRRSVPRRKSAAGGASSCRNKDCAVSPKPMAAGR